MTIVLLGAALILIALLNWFGWDRIVSEKIREKPWRKQFQRGMAIPYAILGVGLDHSGADLSRCGIAEFHGILD